MYKETELKALRDCLIVKRGETYAEITARLRKAQGLFQQLICDQLTQPFNDNLQLMECGTLDDKKHLAKWANRALREFGLSIKCQTSNEASYLIAGPGHKPGEGRFLLVPYSDLAKRTSTATHLPHFELVAHTHLHDQLADDWAKRFQKDSDKKRDRY